MRAERIPLPPAPGALLAPAFTPIALAARERFLRDMAAAYGLAGDARTAELIDRDADVQRDRHRPALGAQPGTRRPSPRTDVTQPARSGGWRSRSRTGRRR